MADALDLGYATVDLGRERRQGLPDANIEPVLATRVEPVTAATVLDAVPDGDYVAAARLLCWRPASSRGVRLAVVTAGSPTAFAELAQVRSLRSGVLNLEQGLL